VAAETRQERAARIFGEENLAELQRKKVLVLGTGLLGGAVTLHLATIGITQMLVDPDTVSEANLANQGFPARRVGDAKVVARADQIRERTPDAQVIGVRARLEDIGLGVFPKYDLIIASLDSRIARLRVAEISQKVRVPWLDLACDGSGRNLLGTITYWDPRVPGASCYACRYDLDALEVIRREGRGPGCPSWAKPAMPITAPTLMAASFGAVISGYGADWAISSLLGRTEEIENRQLQVFGDGLPRVRTLAFERSPHCLLPHEGLGDLVAVPAGTIGDLYAGAAHDLGEEPDALRFHHRRFVPELYCATEDRSWEFPRLADRIEPAALQCETCHPGARRVPARIADHLTRPDVVRFGTLGWRDIGLAPADVVSATAGTKAVHYVVGNIEPESGSLT
jgi:molybdopterin/thiamine biosynthesis adenylyltransferase